VAFISVTGRGPLSSSRSLRRPCPCVIYAASELGCACASACACAFHAAILHRAALLSRITLRRLLLRLRVTGAISRSGCSCAVPSSCPCPSCVDWLELGFTAGLKITPATNLSSSIPGPPYKNTHSGEVLRAVGVKLIALLKCFIKMYDKVSLIH